MSKKIKDGLNINEIGRKTQHDRSNKEKEDKDKDACKSRKQKIKLNKFKYVNEKFKNYTRKISTCIENIIKRILLNYYKQNSLENLIKRIILNCVAIMKEAAKAI